jgi:hypothetical protein
MMIKRTRSASPRTSDAAQIRRPPFFRRVERCESVTAHPTRPFPQDALDARPGLTCPG